MWNVTGRDGAARAGTNIDKGHRMSRRRKIPAEIKAIAVQFGCSTHDARKILAAARRQR